MSAATAASPARIAPDRDLGQDLETPRSIAERIRANGSVCFRAFGGSMFPWIRAGDILFARLCDIERAKAGGVVLFERDGRLFVHRVLRRATSDSQGIARTSLLTKGCPGIRLNRKRRHIDLESVV
jgi:hypothetical protein